MTEAWRPFERALEDAWAGRASPLGVRSDVGRSEDVDPGLFLRAPDTFEEWERFALDRAVGPVLDLGAGAGAHALALQEAGVPVTAVDVLPEAVRIMRARGVRDARCSSIEAFLANPRTGGRAGPWATGLLLMNGTMPFGTLARFRGGLARWPTPPSRIVLDSTDLRDGVSDERDDGRYVGEAQYQFTYEGEAGAPIPQLFVDPDRLDRIADATGWDSEVLWRGERGHYLAELTLRSESAR